MAEQGERLLLQRVELDQLASEPLLQSAVWARQKLAFGWKPQAYSYSFHGADPSPLLVLSRSIASFGTLAYVPWGPSIQGLGGEEPLESSLGLLGRAIASDQGAFVCRFDINWSREDSQLPQRLGLNGSRGIRIQPPDTVLLDLTMDEDQLLKNMKSKTRYNVRLGAKKGVEIHRFEAGDQDPWPEALERWYQLYQDTAVRDKIGIHSKAYYAKLFELAPGKLSIFMAQHQGDDLAGIIVWHGSDRAIYLYGASSNHKRNLMAAYGLQWAAITYAKAVGCTSYDFFGIPPNSDPNHPMHGLYQFKTGFGGTIHHGVGTWDVPMGPGYSLYSSLERLRLWYHHRVKKRS